MSNLIPTEMHPKDIAVILRDMAEGVESGDSLEGSIEFLLPDPPEWAMRGEPEPEGWVDDERDYRLVRGTYRIGNSMGQGGVRMIGTVPGMSDSGDRAADAAGEAGAAASEQVVEEERLPDDSAGGNGDADDDRA